MKPTPTPDLLTEAQFSKYCSFIARSAACWSADILDTSDLMREADSVTVARFTDEIRERLKRLDDRAGISAALSVQPAAAVVGEPVGYVSTPELVNLKMGVSCVDLFREPQPGGIDFAPVYGRPQFGKPWRVFEAITHGWWGIEVDGDNDADPILYPIKINRESLEKIVKHFNEALGGASHE